MQIEHLPKVEVGSCNTPLQLLPHLTGELKSQPLYIKRDDLTGLALGGNKTRKLDYLVAYALENGYTTLMTFGGVQTNHGRLTVAAAVKYGLKSILVLKGAKPDYMSGNLLLDRLMDTELVFVDTTAYDHLPPAERAAKSQAYLEECTRKLVAEKEAQGEKVLNIPVGGQGVIGAAGYIQAVPELMRQMEEQGIQAKHLVVGYGSTGTFAGLWAGAKYYNAPFEVIGIPIEPDYHSLQQTADFLNQISETYDMGFTCTPEEIHLELGPAEAPYGGAGYNLPDRETWETIAHLARSEGVFLDPCYTGKSFRGFLDLVRRGKIAADSGAIFLDTGGAPGLWGREQLDFAQGLFWNDDRNITVFKAQ